MAEMHDTTEEYLETILELEEEGVVPLRARLVELKAGEGLMVVAPFLPSPLIELLRSEGFLSRIERGLAGEWMVSFWQAAV